MSKLHIYTVHINPALPNPYENAQFIEEGFSWKSFLFTFLWGLYHRLWLASAAVFGVNMFLLMLLDSHSLTQSGYFILHASVHVIAGLYGNDWRRAKLAKQGYITADIVTSDSELGAELRFFDRYFASHPAAA